MAAVAVMLTATGVANVFVATAAVAAFWVAYTAVVNATRREAVRVQR